MKLYITEKPSVAKELANFFGNFQKKKGYYENEEKNICITNAVGHLYRYAEPEEYQETWKSWELHTLPIVPEKWKLLPSKNTKDQLQVVQTLIKLADTIVHVGDPDREGQLLIDEILKESNYKGKVQRMLLQAVDTASIQKAATSLRDNEEFKGLSLSGELRAKSDWLIGMNATRAYTKRANMIGFGKTIPIGRVKTPTIALLVHREEEIKNFKPITHFKGRIEISKDDITFVANVSFKELENENGYITDKELLETQLQNLPNSVVVTKVDKKEKEELPPLPHSLDTLQVTMSEREKMSPAKTLSIVQALYEKKYVTYPRSDCNYIPASQEADVYTIQKNLKEHLSFSVEKEHGRAFNDQKITAHHAIIPTTVIPTNLTDEEKKVYGEIALAYALQFQENYIYEETVIHMQIGNIEANAKGKVTIQEGYKKLIKKDPSKQEETNQLPLVNVNETLQVINKQIVKQTTTPPKRFTEATLLKAMTNIYQFVDKENPLRDKLKEIKGIGTPATRASIISDILHQKAEGRILWATIKKQEIIPTDEAMHVIHEIAKELTLPDTTAKMELELYEVEKNNVTENAYVSQQLDILNAIIDHAKNTKLNLPTTNAMDGELKECPTCKKQTILRKKGKYGYFWSCSSCKQTFQDLNNNPFYEICPKCGKPLSVRIGKHGKFIGCTGYKEGCTYTKVVQEKK